MTQYHLMHTRYIALVCARVGKVGFARHAVLTGGGSSGIGNTV